MLSRRDLVSKLAVGAAGMVALAAAGTGARASVKTGRAREDSGLGDNPIPEEVPSAAEAVQPGALESAKEESVATNPGSASPWTLLAPLTLGATVAYGWRVTDLSGPTDGACVLTLQNHRGRVQRVHLCRNDGRPEGLVYTRRLDLVVMNGGRGDLGTDENLAQAVAAVAHVVAANEDRRNHPAIIDALLPHGERLRQFSAANEWALR